MRTLFSTTLILSTVLALKPDNSQENPLWQRTGGPDGATNVAVIAFHPFNDSILYAGTNRGMYKTTNTGETWTETTSGLPTHLAVNDIAIDYDDPSYLYARTDSALYRSVDGGSSWAPVDLHPQGEGGYVLRDLEIDPTQPLVIYLGDGRREASAPSSSMLFEPGKERNMEKRGPLPGRVSTLWGHRPRSIIHSTDSSSAILTPILCG